MKCYKIFSAEFSTGITQVFIEPIEVVRPIMPCIGKSYVKVAKQAIDE
jgi:hypothetical protein